MDRNRIIISSVIVGATLLVLVMLLLRWQSEGRLPPELVMGKQETPGLGFTYLPVTSQVSAYYDLRVNSGALVTSVIRGSPADKAGVKAGDVILSFNGARVERTAPLLGMMMACPVGHSIMLEVWRGENISMLELIHTER